MKPRLLEHLRCPDCRYGLALTEAVTQSAQWTGDALRTRCAGLCQVADTGARVEECPDCARLEVMEGVLTCQGCGSAYAVRGGVPRLHAIASPDDTRPRTAANFGYLWAHSTPGGEVYDTTSYHFSKMETSLSFEQPRGLVLDAGCGDGIDLANQARHDGVEAVGVELSDGGCRTSYARTRGLARAHVVQADLGRLPFAEATFDFAYSYGVLHHMGVPERGLREVTRVAKPGARVAAYLYEDFSERSVLLRWSLRVANAARHLTTRLPNRVLYGLCRFASPIVFALSTVPAKLGRRVPLFTPLADALPFRHGTGPFSLVGDLYDRFSAPVEWRYSRAGSVALFAGAGLEGIEVAAERGWMVSGTKPHSGALAPHADGTTC